MISIVTPVYNAEKYIRECIESIQKQDYPDWEWILVDDGSTDDSCSIVRSYADLDKRIRLIQQDNAGPAAARNRALELVQGDYVTFLDSDDWMEEGALSSIWRASEKKPDVIIWNYKRFSSGQYSHVKGQLPQAGWNDEEQTYKYRLDLIYRMEKQVRQYAPFVWIRAVKTELIKNNNIRFNLSLRRSEDTLFSITVQRFANTMMVLPDEELTVYRENDKSITHSYVSDYMQMVDIIYEDIIKWADSVNDQEMKRRADYMYVYRTFFSFEEEVKYKSSLKAISTMKETAGSPNLNNAIRNIGEKGTESFGRRYQFLKQKKMVLLYLLFKKQMNRRKTR